jgi:hypothetical protein
LKGRKIIEYWLNNWNKVNKLKRNKKFLLFLLKKKQKDLKLMGLKEETKMIPLSRLVVSTQ